jgi:xanthine dehydrogenase accessory factor
VESAAAEEIAAAIERGTPRLVSYGVSDEDAWKVGLACGGTIEVFIEPAVRQELVDAARGDGGIVLATIVGGGPATGWSLLVRDDGTTSGPLSPAGASTGDEGAQVITDAADQITAAANETLATNQSRRGAVALASGDLDVFFELIPRQPRLIIFGGVHIAAPLVTMARTLGYRTIVADAREAYLSRDRFPDADQLVLGWPEAAFAEIGLDRATFVVVLSHDPKLDDPALEIALRSPACYVGAIGSRKTQKTRRDRLRAAGITEDQLSRLCGPVGLDLGGRAPAETALAILAEMTAVRYGKAHHKQSEKAS